MCVVNNRSPEVFGGVCSYVKIEIPTPTPVTGKHRPGHSVVELPSHLYRFPRYSSRHERGRCCEGEAERHPRRMVSGKDRDVFVGLVFVCAATRRQARNPSPLLRDHLGWPGSTRIPGASMRHRKICAFLPLRVCLYSSSVFCALLHPHETPPGGTAAGVYRPRLRELRPAPLSSSQRARRTSTAEPLILQSDFMWALPSSLARAAVVARSPPNAFFQSWRSRVDPDVPGWSRLVVNACFTESRSVRKTGHVAGAMCTARSRV
ncbi:hypothetical protein MRX96_041565 [Rhipicephalus microplus]